MAASPSTSPLAGDPVEIKTVTGRGIGAVPGVEWHYPINGKYSRNGTFRGGMAHSRIQPIVRNWLGIVLIGRRRHGRPGISGNCSRYGASRPPGGKQATVYLYPDRSRNRSRCGTLIGPRSRCLLVILSARSPPPHSHPAVCHFHTYAVFLPVQLAVISLPRCGGVRGARGVGHVVGSSGCALRML